MADSVLTQALPTVWLSFDLAGASFDPDVVSAQLGVEATSRHRAGDPLHSGQGQRRRDRWRVTVGPCESMDIGGMVTDLLTLLEPARTKIRRVCDEFGLEPIVICAVEPTSWRTPDITFSSTLIQWAADTGSAITVDVLLWGEDNAAE